MIPADSACALSISRPTLDESLLVSDELEIGFTLTNFKTNLPNVEHHFVSAEIKNTIRSSIYSKMEKGGNNILHQHSVAKDVIIDYKGEYGLTPFSAAIVDDVENLDNIKKALESERFIKQVMLFKDGLGHKYNNKVISMLKKDFWKDFI